MHPKMTAKMVGTGNNRINTPVPNIPMPRVELKERARAVQVNMASVVAIVAVSYTHLTLPTKRIV